MRRTQQHNCVGGLHRTKTFWSLVILFLCLGFLYYSKASRSSASPKLRSPAIVNQAIRKAVEQRQQDKTKKCPHCGPIEDQVIYTPLVDLREAKESEIVFNSRSPKTMDVSPTFYRADGTPVSAEKVRIGSQEIRYVKIKDLLPKHALGVREWGGMTLSYSGTNREMWAQLRFLKVNGGSSVDEFFTVVSESRSDLYEATWWKPKDSASIVALGNITDTVTSVNVKFGEEPEQVMSLAPHATQLVRREASGVDGPANVRLKVIGAPGSVVPTGIISSPRGTFNSVIRFYSPKLAKQSHLFANGFRVGNIEPHMVLKNTSDQPIVAHPKLLTLGGVTDPTVTLPEVSLGPNETREVDLSQLSAKSRDLDVATVEVTNSGAAGSLIGSLYGIDMETGVNYETPLRDSGPVRTMTGAYPWKISDDYSTVVYITNISDREAGFIAQLTMAVSPLYLILAPCNPAKRQYSISHKFAISRYRIILGDVYRRRRLLVNSSGLCAVSPTASYCLLAAPRW